MKHARQKIREQAATMLASIGITVYRSRVYPIMDPPALSVFCNEETSDSELDAMPSTRRVTRRVALNIDTIVKAAENSDDLLDDYNAQAEAILLADPTLAGTCTDTKLVRTTIRQAGDQEKPVIISTMIFETWYRTLGTDPENAL